jgi:hypothetical protein
MEYRNASVRSFSEAIYNHGSCLSGVDTKDPASQESAVPQDLFEYLPLKSERPAQFWRTIDSDFANVTCLTRNCANLAHLICAGRNEFWM